MSYEDKTITCSECGEDFVHSAEDQARYAERGFTNDPKRCRACRERRKAEEEEAVASGEAKKLVCSDCGQEFLHSAQDQAYYAERGFSNDPKRCRNCREKRKANARKARSGGGRGERGGRGGYGGRSSYGGRDRGGRDRGGREQRASYEAVCAACGAKTTVPFKPTQGRPVYCRECFRSKRT